jgi:hypothetical protein
MIPGLSEYFLYANDDMFFAKNSRYEDWFDQNGRYYFDVMYSRYKKMDMRNSNTPFWKIVRNTRKVLDTEPLELLSHTIMMLSKMGCARAHEKLGPLQSTNVRSENDVHFTLLVSNIDKIEDRNVPRKNTGCYLFTVGPNHYINRFKRNWLVMFNGEWKNTRLGCVNDKRAYPKQHKEWVDHCFYNHWGISV